MKGLRTRHRPFITVGESTHRDGTFPIKVASVLSLILYPEINRLNEGKEPNTNPLDERLTT